MPFADFLTLFDQLTEENRGQRLTRIQLAPANLHWCTDDGLLALNEKSKAANVPTEMSVSIVVAPCRRLTHAARWNGQAPQTTTGAARTSESHCQNVNCSAGTIAMATTGTVRAVEMRSRSRRARVGSAAVS